MNNELFGNDLALVEILTRREREILSLLVNGLSNREIANQLVISLATVKWHNHQIYSKLDVKNRREAAVRANKIRSLRTDYDHHDDFKHNLPEQATPFVGREKEVNDLIQLLDDPAVRLVTVLAPGGMGKTRLALAVAERLLKEDITSKFRNGLYYVPLATQREPEQIITSIAQHIDYQLQPDGRQPKKKILDYLHDKRILFVMDNLEHLLEGASILTDILEAAPGVSIITTSRERLRLLAETVYTISGMTLPERETMQNTLDYDSLQLFIQSAKRANRHFDLQTVDVALLTHICRQVEGMPLAIVLAAAWVDVLPVTEIADEIANGLDLLRAEMRDAPERQWSVRAVFDPTWRRLSSDERQVFQRLAVFQGGGTREALQVITEASLLHLQKLTDKALLSLTKEGRYEMHELLRQYAQEKLVEASQVDETRKNHMTYYAELAQQSWTDLQGQQQLDALNVIKADFDNLRSAWEWSITTKELAIDRMIRSVCVFAEFRSRLYDIEDLVNSSVQAYSTLFEHNQPLLLGRLLAWQGWVQYYLSSPHAEAILRQGLTIAIKHDDQETMAICLLSLIGVCSYQGRFDEAIQLSEHCLSLCRNLDDDWITAQALRSFGRVALEQSRMEDSYEKLQESLAIRHKIGDEIGICNTLLQLAHHAYLMGDWEKAEQLILESISLIRKFDSKGWIGVRLAGASLYSLFLGKFSEAEQLIHECQIINKNIHSPELNWRTLEVLSRLADVAGSYDEAQHLAQATLSVSERIKDFLGMWTARHLMGWVLCNQGQFEAGTVHLNYSMELALQNQKLPFMLIDVVASAQVFSSLDEPELAVELLGLGFEHRGSPSRFLTKHPRFSALRINLEDKLGQDVYRVAWERGASLELGTVVRDLLVRFEI